MEERERILKLLEEGKINAEEAARLLEALGETSHRHWGPGSFGPEFGKRIAKKVELSLKDLPEMITTSISGMGYVSSEGGEKKVEFKSRENLIVKTVSGDIDVTGDDEETIRVSLKAGHKIVDGEDQLVIKSLHGDMDIKTPAKQKLVLKAASGDVNIENLSDVVVKCGSGDLEISGIKDRAAAGLGSGDLEAVNISGPFAASLGSGDLNAKGLTGELTISVGSGDVDLDVDECKGGKVELGSGDLEIKLPKMNNIELTVVKPKDGVIDSDFDLEETEETGEFKAVFGKPAVKLYIKVKHGDITLRNKEK